MKRFSVNSKQCLLVGEGSIARFCLELLQKKGFHIQACVTGDRQLAHWAQSQNMSVIEWHGETQLLQHLQSQTYKLLISVGNLYPIPAEVLSHNDALPINIHDGPMNDFLGFNTPAWALLHGNTAHEVCWHQMTPELYHGDLLSRTQIEIEPEETAMTLNAKCFTAALSSLEVILNLLQNEGIEPLASPKPNLSQVNYFSRFARLDNAGFLSPCQPINKTLNQIRALDNGHSDNPLALAKIRANNQVFHVTSATSAEGPASSSGAIPVGEIVSIESDSIKVQWSDGALQLQVASVFALQTHLELSPALIGASIQEFDDLSQLQQLSQHFGRWEPWWIQQLQGFSALSLPYVGNQETVGTQFESFDLDLPQSFEQTLCLSAAYLARLCDQPCFASPVVFDRSYAGAQDLSELADQLGAPRASFEFTFDFDQTLFEQSESFNTQWQTLLSAGIFSCDLVKRHSSLTQWQTSVDQPYCIFISDEDNQSLKARLACFSSYAVALVVSPQHKTVRAISNGGLIKPLASIMKEIQHFASEIANNDTTAIGLINIVTPEDRELLQQWSLGKTTAVDELLFDKLGDIFVKLPTKTALYHRQNTLTFAELESQMQQVRAALHAAQVKPGDFVGVMMPRCIELMPCLLGVMSFGAACVPMDPDYPADRLEYVIDNSQLNVILCIEAHQSLATNARQLLWSEIQSAASQIPAPKIQPQDIAYMLYTSGSSGKPKGVMVEHCNLANFFEAMNEKIPLKQDNVWLAVTSISFDISLLEMVWTLTRGISVVLYDGQDIQTPLEITEKSQSTPETNPLKANQLKVEPLKVEPLKENHLEQTTSKNEPTLDFGLFFWNISSESDIPGSHQYDLLLKAAEYGDQNGFSSVWTPERHFGDFGGLYPNPAITSAAVAARTKHIHIRAGSCVFPLHHPVRITEDWSIIDNISNGRVGLSAAPGWMPNDFVIMPENHANAKEIMFENIELVQKLWRGDAVTFPGPNGPVDVVTLPRPVQKEVPIWVTTGGNPENFRRAGAMGANLLTHLLGQSVEELGEKIKVYNQARTEAGHEGKGCITVMLHTFVAETREEARAITLEPMKNYLKTALFLVKAAAWDWPLFKKLSENQSQNLDDFFTNISDEDLDALLEFAFDRYFKTSGLFGTQADCVAFADTLYDIGVNEIGCLIDYGVDTDTVLKHLPQLKAVLEEVNRPDRQKLSQNITLPTESNAPFGVAALIERHKVSHLQVTPSMARLFLSDPGITQAMRSLESILVGGEALPLDLAHTLKDMISGPLFNMYGPTETTIWSSVSRMDEKPETISLGQAVANTQLSIVDSRRQPMPIGAIGELFIGGQGVVKGYWQREDLTSEKFITGYPAYTSAEKVYATGDLARYLPDGRLIFLGRNDFQVKVRGYRIELEEIETVLLQQPGIAEAVVHPVVYSGAEPRLVGYYTLAATSGEQITANALKKALHDVLPPFMVPNAFVKLDSFLLTPNAKIDRKALPLPTVEYNQANDSTNEELENASDIECQVLKIWQDILGTSEFGLDDNFFDHGGHSLLVVDVMTRVRPLFTKQIKLIDLFRYPKVRLLVEHLSVSSDASETAVIAGAQSRAAARRAARRR